MLTEILILKILGQLSPIHVKTLIWWLKNIKCNLPAHEGHIQSCPPAPPKKKPKHKRHIEKIALNDPNKTKKALVASLEAKWDAAAVFFSPANNLDSVLTTHMTAHFNT